MVIKDEVVFHTALKDRARNGAGSMALPFKAGGKISNYNRD